jgi:hypothetical protein
MNTSFNTDMASSSSDPSSSSGSNNGAVEQLAVFNQLASFASFGEEYFTMASFIQDTAGITGGWPSLRSGLWTLLNL